MQFIFSFIRKGIPFLLVSLTLVASAQNRVPQEFKPKVVCHLPKEVDETSGLIFWRNSLWTHNDSGGLPVIYRLDTATGKVVQRITIAGAVNHDWEDISQDEKYIYIGDMGNNSGNRHNLCIYRVKKSDIPDHGDVSVPAEKIAFSYPDYKRPVKNRRENNFDDEALMAYGDSLYLFSKDWKDQQTRLYALPKTPGTWTARLLLQYNVQGLITGADHLGSRTVLLTGYTRGTWKPFLVLLTNFSGSNFFSGNVQRINLRAKATQIEAVAFAGKNRVFLSSEGRMPAYKQTLYVFDLNQLPSGEKNGKSGN
ncbi:T9SS C-terminal target domain-containing protein [Candidatus Sulfidibacterium hydrothermale]|uniref:T9SS C-terminal target domain-containing protein n=1 Tax=Candidatus Sulfidibacterium hydrothermale TaxID=2875962 RepID=UPI001F0ABD18|nr:T9SS C-terminal target domain-containing protein [Candidatus Sulfidibacterium hydrothermale]UBM63114.1 T9SS C-terminal target domain-containing protein [Candidatus Sulfidibacterium hydrothermale]